MHLSHGDAPGRRPAEEVVRWRREQLLRTGFDAAVAADLAADPACDLHALLELVTRGCPPGLAARILAPLDQPGEAS